MAVSAQQPLAVVRIKRKRTEETTDDLLVGGLTLPVSKRIALLQQLARLGVDEEAEDKQVADQAHAAVGGLGRGAPLLQFRRVATVCGRGHGDDVSAQEAAWVAGGTAPCPQEGHVAPAAAPVQYTFLGGSMDSTLQLPLADSGLHARTSTCFVYDLTTQPVTRPVPPPGHVGGAAPAADIDHAAPGGAAEAAPGGGLAGVVGGNEAMGDVDDAGGESGDDYVYDLYCLEGEVEGGQVRANGGVPHATCVYIDDNGEWAVFPDDASSSGRASSDSNAEDYYANSYPDEDEWASGSDDSAAKRRRRRHQLACGYSVSGDESGLDTNSEDEPW